MADAQKTTNGEGQQKKSRQRSPNYPAIGLREALERVSRLYQADKMAGAPIDAALRHMGFGRRHGKAMVVLSALRKYGLVEDSGGRIVPSQRALEILVLPETDPRRKQALGEAALNPEIYRVLFDQYRESGFPSDETLKSELIAYRKFNPGAVEAFAADFRDTMDLAGLSNPERLELAVRDQMPPMAESISVHSRGQSLSSAAPERAAVSARQNAYIFSWPLSKEVLAEVRITGPEIQAGHLERLRQYLELAKTALESDGPG